jgi:hypothetical protein
MPVIYSAVKQFDPSCGDKWTKFIEWCGLTQLREVISLDCILCPSVIVIDELTPEDWHYNVSENFICHLFRDLEYLLGKVAGSDRMNVLALMQNPTEEDVRAFNDNRFIFRGFDLLEVHVADISALVNCGGFPKAFAPTDLSDCGLLVDHAKVLRIQTLLRAEYPDEHHADCDVWAIWQMRAGPENAGERIT